MRRIFTITILLCLVIEINADDMLRTRHPRMAFTLDLTPKAGFGNAFFLNPNVDADPNANRYFFCPSYFYGGRLGLTFISSFPDRVFFSVYGEYLFSNITQKYQLKDGAGTTYDHGYNISAANKALFFRTTIFSGSDKDGAMYLEIGKQISTFGKVKETNSGNFVDLNTSNPAYNPLTQFTKENNNIVFGVGGHGLMYSIGLRFTYGLGTLMTSTHQPVDDGHYNFIINNADYSKYYADKKESHLFLVELVFELNLYVLEYGNATCGKKRLFPFPMHLNQDAIW